MRKDSYSNQDAVASLVPAVQAATANGSTVDLKGFFSALMIVNTGAIASAGDYAVKMQHSDSDVDGNFVDVPADDRIGALPGTLLASTVYRQAYIGKKRYVRAVITKTGGTSIAAGAVFLRGLPHLAPVA